MAVWLDLPLALPAEYDLMPVVRDDAAILQRVTLNFEREPAAKPGGQVETPL